MFALERMRVCVYKGIFNLLSGKVFTFGTAFDIVCCALVLMLMLMLMLMLVLSAFTLQLISFTCIASFLLTLVYMRLYYVLAHKYTNKLYIGVSSAYQHLGAQTLRLTTMIWHLHSYLWMYWWSLVYAWYHSSFMVCRESIKRLHGEFWISFIRRVASNYYPLSCVKLKNIQKPSRRRWLRTNWM